MISPEHCGERRAITRWRMLLPPISRSGLSPPPIRRARPPASTTPGMSVIVAFALAPVSSGFLLDVVEVLVVDDALLAGERNEALAAGAPHQRQADLPRQLDAPRREPGARDEDRDAHAHRLDDHFGGEPSGGVQDLVGGIDAMAIDPARDLVDRVVTSDVLGVADRLAFLAEHAAVNGASLEVERWHRVDPVRHSVKPGCSQLGLRERHLLDRLQEVAERRPLGATGRL